MDACGFHVVGAHEPVPYPGLVSFMPTARDDQAQEGLARGAGVSLDLHVGAFLYVVLVHSLPQCAPCETQMRQHVLTRVLEQLAGPAIDGAVRATAAAEAVCAQYFLSRVGVAQEGWTPCLPFRPHRRSLPPITAPQMPVYTSFSQGVELQLTTTSIAERIY